MLYDYQWDSNDIGVDDNNYNSSSLKYKTVKTINEKEVWQTAHNNHLVIKGHLLVIIIFLVCRVNHVCEHSALP